MARTAAEVSEDKIDFSLVAPYKRTSEKQMGFYIKGNYKNSILDTRVPICVITKKLDVHRGRHMESLPRS